MPNDTSCSPSGTCVILTGTVTNGTDFVAQYDPSAAAPHWHSRMELATIIVCNSLSFIVIVSRVWYRWTKLKRFRGDDRWMLFAALILLPFTASQIGTNAYGSGLYMRNVPKSWRPMHWHFMLGWVGYYIVVTSIKLSVCFCFLQILTIHHKSSTYCVYGLCTLIASLGLTMSFSWLFDCSPFLSNFVWSIQTNTCINYDIFRYLWIGVSIPIDLAILSVPVQFLKRLKLRTHERRILKMVFAATLLGTITCAIGIYGAFETRTAEGNNAFYQETAFVMMCDIEILMYTLGASFPSMYSCLPSIPVFGSLAVFIDPDNYSTLPVYGATSRPRSWSNTRKLLLMGTLRSELLFFPYPFHESPRHSPTLSTSRYSYRRGGTEIPGD
ncbi:uncharacterized protein LY89DRAFT_68688 [Mollisia scopiformis]|uniref:Rhodopsin domain-containing protein n=1 Tax=Mollisia scopiformis TaxID=149040 RepID=A0A194X9Y1_MOLSC|nr:uncharacterized protein LY89DRAFT_68688 [Mollisia scopiformis]KUJ16976.1 hypothetical protein LY89DRAFT_68688 [Mollisia scopiformis]